MICFQIEPGDLGRYQVLRQIDHPDHVSNCLILAMKLKQIFSSFHLMNFKPL